MLLLKVEKIVNDFKILFICKINIIIVENYSNVQYWKECPDRDEVLERIYGFIKALHSKSETLELQKVFVKDTEQFRKAINDALKHYLSHSIEDEEWEEYNAKDLSYEIDDPTHIDEDLVLPEFSGTSYTLKKDEDISVKLSLHHYITPIRLHFQLVESDELYYLRVQKLSADN